MDQNTVYLSLFIIFLVILFYCFNKNENKYLDSHYNNKNK